VKRFGMARKLQLDRGGEKVVAGDAAQIASKI
jgi:hypothetical protein